MSANVWFEEVDAGLISEIHSYVKIRNKHGVLVPLHYDPETPEQNAIIVRKPEDEFKIEVFPCVSIYNKSYWHDPMRRDPNPTVVGWDDTKTKVILEEPAIPFNLSYQIDFWARFSTDMNTMTRTWLNKHFRQFNLDVVDDGGTPRNINCMQKGSIQKSDLILGGERLFHSIANLQIWVVIDDEIRYTKPVVLDRDIQASVIENNEEKEEHN